MPTSPTSPAQYDVSSADSFSYFKDTPLFESGSSGQAFFRDVVNAAGKNHLQQATVPFHNPFNNPSFEKRSIEIVYRNPEEDQPLDLTVRKEPLFRDQQTPTYIPGNESFSIQSILGLGQSTPQSSLLVDNDLHQPLPIPNQGGIGTFSKPESPTASGELGYTEPNAHPPLQGASCGETSVNISQSSSHSVALVRPLNTNNRQDVQIETTGHCL